MNFVFISPNYPENYWMFCRGLKKYGANVLAVVDTVYDNLKPELKANITECYVVSSFHNYEEVFKAVAYFSFKYGKIDWIESNNEAWLTLDARLRDDFNVKTGFSLARITEFQSKAAMKKYYEKAGVPTARYCLPKSLDEALEFAGRVGYPLVLKPDHGVGASFTYALHNDEDLKKYYESTKDLCMILEEYVKGDVITLDGVCDANGTIRVLGSMEYVGNCMESVQNQDSIGSYYTLNVSEEYRDIAQRVISAFELKNRFFHGEYFRLTEDVEGLGKKGHIIGLEVNFRPPGGFAPDLLNYSNDIDIYELWAEILLNQTASYSKLRKYSAGFAGRRDSIPYRYNTEEIENMFKDELIGTEVLPPAYAATMGNVTIKARFTNDERRKEFFKTALERIGD